MVALRREREELNDGSSSLVVLSDVVNSGCDRPVPEILNRGQNQNLFATCFSACYRQSPEALFNSSVVQEVAIGDSAGTRPPCFVTS